MTSREIVLRTMDFAGPERLAFDCLAYGRRYTDLVTSYLDWEFQYERKSWVADGKEFYLDAFGNTWARVLADKSTKGEIHRGVLQDSWQGLDSFVMPRLSSGADNTRVRELFESHPTMFKVGCIYNASFGILSALRGFQNLMEDLLLEPERVCQACETIDDELVRAVEGYASCGADGLHVMEDWGSQLGAFISRALWEELFAPGYRRLCGTAHRHHMRVILHSCGMLRDLIPAFLESGVDVLQFDQVDNYGEPGGPDGIERLADEFGGRVTFFCPVDIQHTLVTGDRARIDAAVGRMVRLLGSRKGGFIAKSYGRGSRTYLDAIGCDTATNDFAFECFRKHGQELFSSTFDIPELPCETHRPFGQQNSY